MSCHVNNKNQTMRTEATSMLITTARIRKRPEHVFSRKFIHADRRIKVRYQTSSRPGSIGTMVQGRSQGSSQELWSPVL
jgi:hypothetical protein